MKSWGYDIDIHSFEAFNMNFGYFVQDLALTLSTRGIMQKLLKHLLTTFWWRHKAELNPSVTRYDVLIQSPILKRICFIWLGLRGILILKKFMPKNKLLTLRHIETKPTQQVALIVNQGLGFYICVNWSCSSHIALILLLLWGNPTILTVRQSWIPRRRPGVIL